MDWKKIIRFKVGDIPWEVPLNILVLMLAITVVLMIGGVYLGFSFGKGKF